MLADYEPQTISEFIGNRKGIEEIRNFIKNWKPGTALFLSGQTGVGKSLCIRLIAKDLGLQIIALNSENEIERIINASAQITLSGKYRLVVFDNLENISSSKKIIELIKKTKNPVILIAQNPYERKFQAIRKYCKLVKFGKINYLSITSYLKNIAKKEAIKVDASSIERIAKVSNGDIRSALIDLKTLSLQDRTHLREHEENIFNTLKIILKTHSIENASIALRNSEKTPEEVFRWLVENLSSEYEGNDLAEAYDKLSLADLFYSRIIKRQAWSLKKYFIDMVIGVSVSKKQTYRKFFVYSFPQFRKSKIETITAKIGKTLSISKRKARFYIPLLKFMIKKNKEKIVNEFGFDNDEIKLIKKF